MVILVSACLLGTPCRYDGQSKADERIIKLMKEHTLVPACPEILGGLPTPRPPAERRGAEVVTKDGTDVTEQYNRGAKEAVRLARLYGCRLAVLKAKSPSCGKGEIYDGSFENKLTSGDGTAAAALEKAGVTVVSEEEIEEFLDI